MRWEKWEIYGRDGTAGQYWEKWTPMGDGWEYAGRHITAFRTLISIVSMSPHSASLHV